MKKITFMIFAFLALFIWQANAQVTTSENFGTSGTDSAPTVLTINSGDITVNGAAPIDAVSLGTFTTHYNSATGSTAYCGSWYAFDLAVTGGVADGTSILGGCDAEFNGLDVTGFTTITITSEDIDAYNDLVFFDIDLDVTYTPSTPPNCDAVMTSPADASIDVPVTGDISWSAATGGASGYDITVGTTTGASDVYSASLGDVTTVNVGSLAPGTTFYVNIVPTNANGAASGCTEYSFTTINAPEVCPEVTAVTDPACGNYDSQISWLAIDGADGYTITAGTTPGANDIEDATDLGTSLSYTFTNQVAGANYYYTVNAYNTAGQTSGCAEGSFTTFSTSCYCESIPSSNDGTGIGSLQVGTTDFTSGGDVTYEDFTGTPVDLGQGLTANVQIVFQTGWTYDTNIWIDFNDDFVFDSSEQVFDGVSLADNPTTLDASFMMPATAALGQHRMRIGTADSGQATPNSCYNGAYGVTMDLDVNIIVVTCSSPVATTTVNDDCANNQFSVDVEITDLGDATSLTISNDGGVAATTGINATGTYTVGPFAQGTPVNLVLEHEQNAACNVNLGSFEDNCPPLTIATLNLTGDCGLANDSAVSELLAGELHWYELVYDATCTDFTIDTEGGAFDTEIGIYDASGNLIGNNDDGGTGTLSSLTLSGQPAGTYYVVVGSFNMTFGATGWNVTTTGTNTGDLYLNASTVPENDECAGAFPLTLGVEMSGDNTGATDSGVTSACVSGIISDVWYSFVGPASTEVSIECTAANFSVFSDCTTELVCNQQTVTGLVDGQTYYVRVTDDGTARMQAPGAFTLTVSEVALSTAQFDQELGFSYYPNPVNNNLTLKSQKEINNVSVFNMIGQEVYRNVPNTMTEVVDMTNLQAGAYFVKVTIGNSTNTIKVIKN